MSKAWRNRRKRILEQNTKTCCPHPIPETPTETAAALAAAPIAYPRQNGKTGLAAALADRQKHLATLDAVFPGGMKETNAFLEACALAAAVGLQPWQLTAIAKMMTTDPSPRIPTRKRP